MLLECLLWYFWFRANPGHSVVIPIADTTYIAVRQQVQKIKSSVEFQQDKVKSDYDKEIISYDTLSMDSLKLLFKEHYAGYNHNYK